MPKYGITCAASPTALKPILAAKFFAALIPTSFPLAPLFASFSALGTVSSATSTKESPIILDALFPIACPALCAPPDNNFVPMFATPLLPASAIPSPKVPSVFSAPFPIACPAFCVALPIPGNAPISLEPIAYSAIDPASLPPEVTIGCCV